MGNDDGARSDKGVQSVERALKVLEILAQHGEVGVSALAAEVGIHKSSVSRLLSSLEEHELVAQSYARGKYRLSLGVLRLAHPLGRRMQARGQGRILITGSIAGLMPGIAFSGGRILPGESMANAVAAEV